MEDNHLINLKETDFTDKTSKMTEQTEINISSFSFAIMSIEAKEKEENTYV